MEFVIPGRVLENLICYSCQRFLSVPSVKVYPNKYVKCGRCSQNNDNGVISCYQLVAEKSLFKCVNRFDGCRTLLRCSQVVEHEAKCTTKMNICPICETLEVPTFMIPEHFEKQHQSLILRNPCFSVDLRESFLEYERIYFYRFKDDLFIIAFRLNPAEEVIFLNTFHFGKRTRAVDIEQQFIVEFTGTEITLDTDRKLCTPYSKEGLKDYGKWEGFVIEFSDMSMKNHIDIQLKITVADIVGIFTVPTSVQMESKPVGILSTSVTETDLVIQSSKSTDTVDLSKTHLIESDSLRHLRTLSDICFHKKLTIPRKLYLDPYFRKHYPEFSTDLDFYNVVKTSSSGRVEIILPCYVCHELNFDENTYGKSVFQRQNKSYVWICSSCYIILKNSEAHTSTYSHARLVLEHDAYYYMQHFCSWGCTTPSYYTGIFKHEIYCVSQPLQSCPVSQCTHSGKLFEIEKHFYEKHTGTQFVSLQSTFITKVNRTDRYEFQWYVWTPPSFVLVKFSWNLNIFGWSVAIAICEEDSKLQPIVYLFDNDWKVLKVIQAIDTPQVKPEDQYICETDNVRIKCLVKPK